MKKIMLITVLLGILLTGCNGAHNKINTSNLQKQNRTLQDQVKQLQSQLQVAKQKNQELQDENGSIKKEAQTVKEKFPKLAKFFSPQKFKKIEIKYDGGSKSITDAGILKAFSYFIIIKQHASLGSGPIADLKPVQYILTTDQGTEKVNIVQQGIASFEDLYPGQYFEVNNDAYQLAKAFMERPAYLGQESLVAKMVQSGLLKVEGNETSYVYNPGRIQNAALIFFKANKTKIQKPSKLSKVNMKLTFYYYGDQIQMNLYNGSIEIKSTSSDNWYGMNSKDIKQISEFLSAS